MIRSLLKSAFVLCAIVLLAACGGKVAEDNTLKIIVPGKRPALFDEVISEAENRLYEDGYGDYDLQFEFVNEDEYSDTVYVKLLAGNEYDIACNLSKSEFESYTNMELNQPIGDHIFNSDEYPDLKVLYPKELWAAQQNYYGGIYGIPSENMYCKNIPCLYYRSDFAREWGMDKIESEAEFFEYLDRCGEENIKPLAVDERSGGEPLFGDNFAELLKNHILRLDDLGYEAYILLDESHEKVLDIAFLNEPKPENAELRRAVLNRRGAYDKMRELFTMAAEGGKDDFTNGDFGAYRGYITGCSSVISRFGENTGICVLPFGGEDLYTDFSADCYNFIPFTSKKPQKALAFLDWLASDTENQYLFLYGVEGESWERTGEKRFSMLDEEYVFNAGYFLNNPSRDLEWIFIPEYISDIWKSARLLDNYAISPLAGFKFNSSAVSGQTARIKNVFTSQKCTDYYNGRIENPADEMLSDYAKLTSAQEDIKKELKTQIEYYLEHGKNQPY